MLLLLYMMCNYIPILSCDGIEVTWIRRGDGYLNATKLCKAGGRMWGHYFANKQTKCFLDELRESARSRKGLHR